MEGHAGEPARRGPLDRTSGGACAPLSEPLRLGMAWVLTRVAVPSLHGPQAGIDKLIRILEGEPNESQFNAEQYMKLYT